MPLIPPNRVTVFPLKDDLQWYDPEVIFQPFDDIFGRGVIGSTDLQVIQNGASGDGQISVKAGRGYVPYASGGKRQFQTKVDIRSDAAEFLNAVPSWGGGNPRVHRIIARIRDATLTPADQIKGGVFDVLPGTATAGANLTNLSGAQAVPTDALLLGNLLQDSAANPTAKIDTTFGTVRARARIGAGASPTKGFQVASAALTDRGWLNFIAGSGISISAADNPANDSADLTITNNFVPDLKLLMDYTVSASGGDATIDTQTILGGALPTTYKALKIIGYVASTGAGNDGNLRCRFNTDSNTNYDNGISATPAGGAGPQWIDTSTAQTYGTVVVMPHSSSTRFSVFEMTIPNYAFASFPRVAIISAIEPLIINSLTLGVTVVNGGFLWRIQTSVTDVPISRLTFFAATGNLRQNSRISVYGM